MAASPAELTQRYLRHLTIERGRSPHTVAGYRRDLDCYLGWLDSTGRTDLADVRRGDLEAFLVDLGEGRITGRSMSPATAARMLSAVRGLHRFAIAEGMAGLDPTDDLRPPKAPLRLPKALSIDEVLRLLAAAGGDEPERLRDLALLEFLYATGARVSEAVGLDVDDAVAALETGLVRLTGKGAKQRIVPLGSHAQAALTAYLTRARPGFAASRRASAARGDQAALFLGVRGGRLSRQHVWIILRDTAERAEVTAAHLSPHTMRHSFATHLLAGGADVRVVQELLGHASVATTQIYTKVTSDTLRDAILEAHPRGR